jgi:hypothetical protein
MSNTPRISASELNDSATKKLFVGGIFNYSALSQDRQYTAGDIVRAALVELPLADRQEFVGMSWESDGHLIVKNPDGSSRKLTPTDG